MAANIPMPSHTSTLLNLDVYCLVSLLVSRSIAGTATARPLINRGDNAVEIPGELRVAIGS